METKNIMIVGVGGQGTLLTSRILGGVMENAGYKVKVSEVHGMAQRGGSVVTFVRYGTSVAEPIVEEGQADVLIAFERLEALRYANFLKKDGVLIVNDWRIDPISVVMGAAKYPDNIIENRRRIQREFSMQTMEETMQKPEKATTADEEFLNRALSFVYSHIEDEDYDRDSLAAEMGTSTSTLYNKLRSITGLNVSSFIRDIRMKEASRLAEENPNIRVSDLAYRVGFKDPRYFSTCFKKHFGMQPKEYLDSLQQKTT